ncbi:Myb/SANT-like DNA-binding domain-containing protein [Mariannaea sp. PMI_226]|nr:Myb/SANT-like DNA-binding domain-containing protein [Mariannaea sp. PMI_226]
MSEDDTDVLGPDGQPPARVDRDRRAPRFSWTPAYEATFFNSLCDSVQLGLRENSSFKAEAWERAAQALQASHAAYPTKSHLINKSDNARKRFRLWRGLREDPEFTYNSTTKTVSASEEAWTAHIEREPLSRALRGRPFEHEEYMEILYPDVIGSGGAPKRIMKPRRRTDGPVADDSDMPGTGILNLQSDPPPHHPAVESPNQRAATVAIHGNQKPVATVIPPRQPVLNASALTPPDDTVTQSRKRQLPTTSTPTVFESTPPASTGTSTQHVPESPEKRRRTSSNDGSRPLASSTIVNSCISPLVGPNGPSAASPSLADSQAATQGPLLDELIEAVRARTSLRWQEEALDIFFRDFADEDLDLQVKISESVLVNESKAMVFCKMPTRVRQHWMKRFREPHHKA